MSSRVDIQLRVNGKAYTGRCEPRMLLSDFLRQELGLTGTHVGCEHGVCGVCTILFNRQPARSCLILAVQAQDAELETVEGLAKGEDLHPLQLAFHENHGLQCGFCTPGMLMVALDFLKTNPSPTEAEAREAISAVLCRCTGYRDIIRSVIKGAEKIRAVQAGSERTSQ